MATFQLYKQTKNRALYRQNGAGRSVRFDVRAFEGGTAPEAIEIGAAFAPITATVGGGKKELPADVQQAAELLRQFRERRRQEREARMTPEQKAQRDAKAKEKKEKKTKKTEPAAQHSKSAKK